MKESSYSEMEIRMALKNPGMIFDGGIPHVIKEFFLLIETHLKKGGSRELFLVSAQAAKREILLKKNSSMEESARKMLPVILDEASDSLRKEFFPPQKEKKNAA